ncbi:hypothetical protein AB3N04_07000 [Alkalihalophilus sp. As8PL]|uniref:Uncharacterized protein n=1 Tax=Alkalihalophilus sp. As8PL TaxID=3237103 RepID=A0AB39BVX9_9BACI
MKVFINEKSVGTIQVSLFEQRLLFYEQLWDNKLAKTRDVDENGEKQSKVRGGKEIIFLASFFWKLL